MTTVAELTVGAQAEAWRAVGFEISADGVTQLSGIRVRLVGGDSGISEWMLADAPDSTVLDIDGLRTSHGAPCDVVGSEHPNGVFGIDHVVVYTPDLQRTTDVIAAATDAPLKRIREVGSIRQGFHRLGELIVEVVTFPQVTVEHATFWGLALNVRDLDAMFDRCGDGLMSPPKDAVQQGRRIASFRESAGLGVRVAVMSVRR